jgi:apolipoprotein N-acyltransferase
MSVFAGALLATFAYLFTILTFMPPPLTLVEGSIIIILGIWACIEMSRSFSIILKS